MLKMQTCLWFDDNGEEAMKYYVSIFPNSKINEVTRYGEGAPMPAGTMLVGSFELNGMQLLALNGGPHFKFTEAISISVTCDTQAEVDHLWNELTANGGQESMCGWLKDKYGLSWQIVPSFMSKALSDPDPARKGRVMGAMMQMRKLDIAMLQRAYDDVAA